MNEKDYLTIVGSLLYMVDHGAITEAEYASAYNAINEAVETEAMYEGLCK